MPTIEQIGISIGKGMSHQPAEVMRIGCNGLFGDREYMWVEDPFQAETGLDEASGIELGRFLSLRDDPALTNVFLDAYSAIGVQLYSLTSNDQLFIPRAADIPANRIPVSVWSWSGEGVDQGDEVAEIGHRIFGRPVRLVAVSEHTPRFVEKDESLGRVGFSDSSAITVGSLESHALINRQLGKMGLEQIPANRSRTTLLLGELELPNRDSLPEYIFPEDYIESITIASNGLVAVLRKRMAIGRCSVIPTDEFTGELQKGPSPLSALAKLGRRGKHVNTTLYGDDTETFWTQGFVIELPEGMEGEVIELKRGMEVEVTYSNDTNWTPARRAV